MRTEQKVPYRFRVAPRVLPGEAKPAGDYLDIEQLSPPATAELSSDSSQASPISPPEIAELPSHALQVSPIIKEAVKIKAGHGLAVDFLVRGKDPDAIDPLVLLKGFVANLYNRVHGLQRT